MGTAARKNQAWEKVLAAIEADAAKAAALLIDDVAPTAHTDSLPAEKSPTTATDVAAPPAGPPPGQPAPPGHPGEAEHPVPGHPRPTAYIPTGSGAPARFDRPTAPADVHWRPHRNASPAADNVPAGTPPDATDAPDRPAPAVTSVIPAAQPTPATWRLPANPEEFQLELPDPADMPPIPEELRERIARLQTRIEALKSDLAKALAEARPVPTRPARPAQPATPPGFVDRKL